MTCASYIFALFCLFLPLLVFLTQRQPQPAEQQEGRGSGKGSRVEGPSASDEPGVFVMSQRNDRRRIRRSNVAPSKSVSFPPLMRRTSTVALTQDASTRRQT